MEDKSRFISPYERRMRIEGVMELRGFTHKDGTPNWGGLASAMNVYQSTVNRSFKVKPGSRQNVSINLIMKLARTLEFSAGFFIDRKET